MIVVFKYLGTLPPLVSVNNVRNVSPPFSPDYRSQNLVYTLYIYCIDTHTICVSRCNLPTTSFNETNARWATVWCYTDLDDPDGLSSLQGLSHLRPCSTSSAHRLLVDPVDKLSQCAYRRVPPPRAPAAKPTPTVKH